MSRPSVALAAEKSILRSAADRVARLERRIQVLTAKLERAQITSKRRKRAVEAERDRVRRRDARIEFLEDQVAERIASA